MSEVIKRDKTVWQLGKLCVTIERTHDEATLDVIDVWDKQIGEIWKQFNERHRLVLERAGYYELGEQNTVLENAQSSYSTACLMIEKQRVALLRESTKTVVDQ